MATIRIPLVGSFNQRGLDGNATLTLDIDQRFLNCTFDLVHNPITKKTTVYVAKRLGWESEAIVAVGSASTGLIKPQSFSSTVTAFGETNSTLYLGTISIGTITGRALHFTETVISNVTYVMVRSSDGTGWYYPDGAKDDLTYIGDTHNGTAVIDSLDNTTGVYIGQAWSGTGIAAGARVLTVDSSSQVTLNANSSADGTDITFTKEPIAKILDSDYITTGTQISAFAEMDGYLFYVTNAGSIYNSDLNSVTSFAATGFQSPNMSPDPPIAIARHKNTIIVLGANSKEVYFNAENASGSPLKRIPQYFDRIGTLDQRSVVTLENEIYFVSSPYEGDVGVYQIKELQSKRISTPQVDRILGNISSTDGAAYLSAFRMGGYSYISIFCSLASDGPASNLLLESGDALLLEDSDNILLEDTPAESASFIRLLVYNIDLELWSEWDCDEATFIDSTATGIHNQIIATSRVLTTGKIYTIHHEDDQSYQDDGSAYTMEVRTSKLDLGTSKRKRIYSIRLICDSDLTGTAYLSWSDDDYATWSTPRAFDLTSKEPKLSNCGSHKGGRAYKLTHSSNSAFRAEALEIEYESEADKVRKRE